MTPSHGIKRYTYLPYTQHIMGEEKKGPVKLQEVTKIVY